MSEFRKVEKHEPVPEKGANVRIDIKFIRHGERTKDGLLTDYGREITRERARKSGIKKEEYDAVKAYGSPAGPKGATGMQRSLETAHIFTEEIAGDKAMETRARKLLSYEEFKTPVPYNHVEVYNANLPSNFDALSDAEKVQRARLAQEAVVDHILALDTPQARDYKKEAAGAIATYVDHYARMAKRLQSESRVLLPSGSHGGIPLEIFLQQALIRELENGRKIVGFQTLEEIGGSIAPSESFTVTIETDAHGELKQFNVVFDNHDRPKCKAMYLDLATVKRLREFYATLHAKNSTI